MSTFAEMQSRIADDVNRSDLTTQIQKAINRSIAHYSGRDFWFTETTGTFSCVASQEAYGTADSLPSDLRDIVLAQVTVSGNDYELTRRSIGWLQKQDPSDNSGQPTDYAFFQKKMYLYPIPDSTYTITLFYKKSYSDLSATSDTNDFTTIPEAEELIEYRANWWLNKRVIKDREEAQECKNSEIEALETLQNISNNFTNGDMSNQATDF